MIRLQDVKLLQDTQPSFDYQKPYIHHLRIAVSYYCNLRCQHCYVPELNRVEYKHLLEASQLSLEQIDDFIDLLIEQFGLEKISITGGEALLNIVWPRTRHVMQHALGRGLEVQINTSGSGQVDVQDIIEARNGSGKLLLQVSLDGIQEDKVDKFRGQKGAMRRALKTIRDAVAEQVPIQVRYTATEDNFDDTVECYDLVTEIGIGKFNIKPMFAAGTARENLNILITSNDAVRELQRQLLLKSVNRRTKLGLPQPVYLTVDEFPAGANVEVINCECGGKALYLSTNGDIYPCTYLVGHPRSSEYVLGNIKDPDLNFYEVWLNPNTYAEFRNTPRHANCTAQNVMNRVLPIVVLPDAQAQCG